MAFLFYKKDAATIAPALTSQVRYKQNMLVYLRIKDFPKKHQLINQARLLSLNNLEAACSNSTKIS